MIFCVLDDFFRFSKKSGFGVFFVQQNMVETMHPDGLETSGQRAYRQFCHISRHLWVFAFLVIFPFVKKIGFWGILGQPSYGIGATISIGREMLCLPYAGFFRGVWSNWDTNPHSFYIQDWSIHCTSPIPSNSLVLFVMKDTCNSYIQCWT